MWKKIWKQFVNVCKAVYDTLFGFESSSKNRYKGR